MNAVNKLPLDAEREPEPPRWRKDPYIAHHAKMFAEMGKVPDNSVQMVAWHLNEYNQSERDRKRRSAERRQNIIDMAVIHRKKEEVERIVKSMEKAAERERKQEKEEEERELTEWRQPQSLDEAKEFAKYFAELAGKTGESAEPSYYGDEDDEWEDFTITRSDLEELQE